MGFDLAYLLCALAAFTLPLVFAGLVVGWQATIIDETTTQADICEGDNLQHPDRPVLVHSVKCR